MRGSSPTPQQNWPITRTKSWSTTAQGLYQPAGKAFRKAETLTRANDEGTRNQRVGIHEEYHNSFCISIINTNNQQPTLKKNKNFSTSPAIKPTQRQSQSGLTSQRPTL
jgi:hypothetical protein